MPDEKKKTTNYDSAFNNTNYFTLGGIFHGIEGFGSPLKEIPTASLPPLFDTKFQLTLITPSCLTGYALFVTLTEFIDDRSLWRFSLR